MSMISDLFSWLTPILISAVAFFLHQLVSSVKEMATDIGSIKVTISAHAAKVDGMVERIDRMEDQITTHDQDIKDFLRVTGNKHRA